MRKQACQFLAASAIATAAIAGTTVPSMAATTHAGTQAHVTAASAQLGGKPDHFVPGPAPANETRTSHTTQNAWSTWNQGGANVGGGLASLISAAVVGIPAWFLDTVSGALHALHIG